MIIITVNVITRSSCTNSICYSAPSALCAVYCVLCAVRCFTRATSRRHTVVFSNCAVIRRIRGKLFFMLQVSELRAMQLVETHVRLYVVRHESMPGGVDEDCCEEQFPSPAPAPALSAEGGGGAFTTSQPRYRQSKKQIQVNSEEDVLYTQTFAMRLSQPNDDLGGKILLSTPQIIVHEIDAHSPL